MKRKFTRIGEEPKRFRCTKRKCKWEGTFKEQAVKQRDEDGYAEHVCPKCGNPEFFGLL